MEFGWCHQSLAHVLFEQYLTTEFMKTFLLKHYGALMYLPRFTMRSGSTILLTIKPPSK